VRFKIKREEEFEKVYTIILNKDKSLIASIRTTLYQHESLVDKIQFLLPQNYEDIDIYNGNYTVIVKYLDQANVVQSEILEKDDDLYKDYVRFVFPVTSKLTRFAGDVKIWLSIIGINTDDSIKSEVLHTDGLAIKINPLEDIYGFIPDESLQTLDKKILELQAVVKANNMTVESIDKNKADNIKLDLDEKSLYLTNNGVKTGSAIALNDLGDAIADNTEDGLVSVITEDEEKTDNYSLELSNDGKEINVVKNGEIIKTISANSLVG